MKDFENCLQLIPTSFSCQYPRLKMLQRTPNGFEILVYLGKYYIQKAKNYSLFTSRQHSLSYGHTKSEKVIGLSSAPLSEV